MRPDIAARSSISLRAAGSQRLWRALHWRLFTDICVGHEVAFTPFFLIVSNWLCASCDCLALTPIHLISISVTITSVSSARSTPRLSFSWLGPAALRLFWLPPDTGARPGGRLELLDKDSEGAFAVCPRMVI
ncbi:MULTISPECIES: hypothetical protein [Rhizobium]|uniref:hypothetical protein n=1 Tax=Rhizobium TaxID=379 RepID=UPI00104AFD3D|nr:MULTISPECIES: hypothetical protein [Rhizobium]